MDANLNRRPDGITLVWPGETEARLQWFGSRGAALGHMWDHVANKDPKSLGTMTRLGSTADLKVDQWARKTCDAAEIVRFTDPKFARSGPIALMIHDDGQRQEYRDIEIETDPIEPDRLPSVKGK